MLNIERFILYFEEWFNCDIKHWYHFTGKQEEYVFLLEDGSEIIVKEPEGEKI